MVKVLTEVLDRTKVHGRRVGHSLQQTLKFIAARCPESVVMLKFSIDQDGLSSRVALLQGDLPRRGSCKRVTMWTRRTPGTGLGKGRARRKKSIEEEPR